MLSADTALVPAALLRLAAHGAAGLPLALLLVRPGELGVGFDRLIAALAALLIALVLAADSVRRNAMALVDLAGGDATLLSPLLLAAAGLALLLVALRSPGRRDLWLAGAAAAALSAAAVDAMLYPGPVALSGIGFWLHPASALCGASLLGTVLVSMVCGHWYLVGSDLPIDPLRRASSAAFWLILGRAAIAAAALSWWWTHFDPTAADWPRLLSGIRPFLLGRLGLGLLLPFAAMFLVRGTVRLRATQSATGILYFVFIFLAAAELMAGYVVLRTGIPL